MLGTGILRGMGVTMKNFMRPTHTIQYPDRRVGLLGAAKHAGLSPLQLITSNPRQAAKALLGMATVSAKALLGMVSVSAKIDQSPRFRGNEFAWYEDRCTGCASCAKYCPLGIIEIVTHPGGIDVQEGESYGIDVFDIDIARCMFCGLCVEACPYDALHMGSQFERANYVRANLVIPKDQLISNAKRPSSWYRPQFEAQGYNPWRGTIGDHHDAGRHEQPGREKLTKKWVDNR